MTTLVAYQLHTQQLLNFAILQSGKISANSCIHAYIPVSSVKLHDVVLVAVFNAVLAYGTTGSHITGQAAVEVSHGVCVLLGDREQALSQLLSHIQSDPVTILLVVYTGMENKGKI